MSIRSHFLDFFRFLGLNGDDHQHSEEHVEEEDGMDHQFGLSWLGHQLDWVHPSDIPHHVKDVQERLHKSVVRQWRQAITGDPDRYECMQCTLFTFD